jgi:hypothetical protein
LHIGGAAECNETYYSSEQTQKHGGEVIEDDTGSRELHNLETAWNAAHMKANSNNVAVPVPKYGEISTPSEKPYHYFLKGGIVSKQSDLSLPKWLKSTNYGTNSYDGETVTTGKYTDKLEQSVICMPSQSTDYSKGHEAYAEFDVATSNCLYNMRIPLVSRDDASDSRPTQYDRIKSVLVENSGELRGLFEKYPNVMDPLLPLPSLSEVMVLTCHVDQEPLHRGYPRTSGPGNGRIYGARRTVRCSGRPGVE